MWIWLAFLGAVLVCVLFTLLQEARHQLWVLAVVDALQRRGQPDAARRFLERAVTERTLRGERCKPNLRYRLAWIYMDSGNYGAAAEQLRAALSVPHKPNLEVMLRQRLADCLEGLGDPAGAASERARVSRQSTEAPRETDWYLNEARRHEGELRYDAACAVYREALQQLPSQLAALRPRILVQLALASFNAGHADETVRYAEEALTLHPDAASRNNAHSTAGIGYSALGMLDRSEAHRQRAYELALQTGNRDQAARYRVSISIVQMKRGKLTEAVRGSTEAVQMSLDARRQARMIEADCLRLRGQWDAARTAYRQAREAKGHAKPSAERRSLAVVTLAEAGLEVECGCAEAALRLLDGVPELANDPKLGLWSDATRARALALLGRSDEARALIASLDARLALNSMDAEVRRACDAGVGYALLLLGEHEASGKRWQRYLDSGPDPVYRPNGLYHLALCRRELRDVAGARRALAETIALDMPTHFTREAHRLLDALDR